MAIQPRAPLARMPLTPGTANGTISIKARMSRAGRLRDNPGRNPGSLTFTELVRLASLFGFHQVRQLLDYARTQGWLED